VKGERSLQVNTREASCSWPLEQEVGYQSPKGPPVTEETVAENTADVELKPAQTVVLPPKKLSSLILDVLALVGAIAVSIIAGLSLFYFGKSFGTLEDYLTVIFAGTAAQVVSKAILEKLSVFVHDISPLAQTQSAAVVSIVPHTHID
jgi:hypothetical protein